VSNTKRSEMTAVRVSRGAIFRRFPDESLRPCLRENVLPLTMYLQSNSISSSRYSTGYEPGLTPHQFLFPYPTCRFNNLALASTPYPCTLVFKPQPFEPHRVETRQPKWQPPDKLSSSKSPSCLVHTTTIRGQTTLGQSLPRKLPSRSSPTEKPHPISELLLWPETSIGALIEQPR
jgi:hypothetical protein